MLEHGAGVPGYSDLQIWGMLLVIAFIGTTLPRASFFVLGDRVNLPDAVLRALRYAPAAALTAIVAPDVLLVGGTVAPLNPKLLAAIVVTMVTLRWRNPWLPFIAGMGVLWGVQGVVGQAGLG